MRHFVQYVLSKTVKNEIYKITILAVELDDRNAIPGSGKRCFSTPQRPDQFWQSPSLLHHGHWGSIPEGETAW
jgi:hypothetical protein